ncbi:WXG100 family type VII secretion target [Nocardia sp. CDC159]|uniref:ESAT-6-like protein n=1 Tax=Nocardia pulmonis TaxID=2951408 RepID=A0A9X2E841_9NOCA|nr:MULTISPECIES: WXG100 family type VII secretion target [Nocardia]MCM6776052.1 WXG100 family type VII secretion target [Nocardia pulmonis]MCM6788621.1 WXG100 family type VII secretion target [Nocardia sp. CDC159]
MSSQFAVDLDRLDQIVSRLNGLAGFLHDHLEELDRRVNALRNGSWESAAAAAYAQTHAQWLAAAREFAEGVAAMSDAAHKAHGRYTQAIDINRRMLQSGQP